jgi:hypothetical protein
VTLLDRHSGSDAAPNQITNHLQHVSKSRLDAPMEPQSPADLPVAGAVVAPASERAIWHAKAESESGKLGCTCCELLGRLHSRQETVTTFTVTQLLFKPAPAPCFLHSTRPSIYRASQPPHPPWAPSIPPSRPTRLTVIHPSRFRPSRRPCPNPVPRCKPYSPSIPTSTGRCPPRPRCMLRHTSSRCRTRPRNPLLGSAPRSRVDTVGGAR